MTQLGQTEQRGLQCHSLCLIFLYHCNCCVNIFMLRQKVNISSCSGTLQERWCQGYEPIFEMLLDTVWLENIYSRSDVLTGRSLKMIKKSRALYKRLAFSTFTLKGTTQRRHSTHVKSSKYFSYSPMS